MSVLDEDFKFTELRNTQTIRRLSDAEFATSSGSKNGNTSDLQQPRAERHRPYRRHGVAIIKIRHGVFDSVIVRTINGISSTGSIRTQLVTFLLRLDFSSVNHYYSNLYLNVYTINKFLIQRYVIDTYCIIIVLYIILIFKV